MHTRASTSDSSNLDDYIAPRPLLVRNCSASGTKFNDLDQDGVKDAGEPGLAGFRIWADYDNDGVRDAGEPFADTDASGNYTITNIQDPSGTYSLREQLSPGGGSTGGWICSAPQTTGTGGDFPCAYTGINGATTPNVSGKDFGNYKPGSRGDRQDRRRRLRRAPATRSASRSRSPTPARATPTASPSATRCRRPPA